jgi:hypothetical protein
MDTGSAVKALVGANLAVGAWSYAVDGVTPSWVVYPMLLSVALALLSRSTVAASAYLAGVAAVFTLVHLPFARAALSADCTHPADPSLACHPVTWLATLTIFPALTAVLAGLLWWQGRRARVLAVAER